MKPIFLAMLLAAAIATPTAAQDVAQLSDSAVAAALNDVKSMSAPELRSLLDYLAQCDDRNSPLSIHPCKAARFKYVAEFGKDRQIDRTLQNIEKVFEVRAAITAVGVSPSKPTPMTDLARQIARATGEALRSKQNR